MTRTASQARSKTMAAVVIVAMLAIACGQKPGVHVSSGQGLAAGQPAGFGVGDPVDGGLGTPVDGGDPTGGDGQVDPTSGDPAAPADPGTSSGAGGAATGSPGGGSGSSGGATGTSGGGSGGGGGVAATPTGSDRTGAGPDAITIAIHAPVTGAAPLPATSFEKSADLYWRSVISKGQTVLGRTKVNVVFKDDKYTPSTAVQACRELAASAFMLVGGGGTDQVQACGRFANQARVPYVSAGVTEAGLGGLPWYFAFSMTYKQQADLLAQYIKKNLPGKKMAMIVTDTANFEDAVQGWEAAVAKHGIPYYKTLKHTKGDTSWINTFASELRSNGVELIYPLTAPVDYIRFAQQNSGDFNYAGVGITMGLNAVAGSGCPHVDKGIFLSPVPGLDWARDNEPDFFKAGQAFGAPTDDIALLLWGFAKAQHRMFLEYAKFYGDDLTREDFRNVLEQSSVQSNLFPAIGFTPQNHFGGKQVHVIQTDCSIEEHKTLATFKSSF